MEASILPNARINGAELWRQRAEEARAKAEAIRDAAAKRSMMEVAAAYDEMAKRAEGVIAAKRPSS